MLIKNVFIEGPDCSGKTTVINKIHKHTNYRYHMFDRSRMSKNIFSLMYNRDDDYLNNQLYLEERNDLSNIYIVLLPDLNVVIERFKERGDEIHDLEGIKKVYHAFENEIENIGFSPNIAVIKSSDNQWKLALDFIEKYEKKSEFNLIKHFVYASEEKEIVSLKSSEFGLIKDLKKNLECMKFKKEKEYYEQIEKDFIQKIIDEISGKNEYNRKENQNSRRFIFVSDTCISSIHAIVRNDLITFNVYMRSSNVDQINHDYSFIKNLILTFKNLMAENFRKSYSYYEFNLLFGSAHVVREKK